MATASHCILHFPILPLRIPCEIDLVPTNGGDNVGSGMRAKKGKRANELNESEDGRYLCVSRGRTGGGVE